VFLPRGIFAREGVDFLFRLSLRAHEAERTGSGAAWPGGKMRKISIALMLILWGAAGAAYSEEQSGSAGAAQPEQPSGAVGANKAGEPSGAAGAQAEPHSGAAGAAHADPAYAQKLAVAVRARVPTNAKVGAGAASCSFQVTANGSVSGISCKGSSPAHSQLLQKAIAATKAPPPPGGSFSANQSVVFH
jgi:hypothetical protein